LNLKELNELYPFYERSRVRGLVDADINAQFFLQDLIDKKIYNLHSQSTLTGDDVFVNIPQTRTRVMVDSLRASLYTNTGVKFGRRSSRIDTSLVNARIAFSNMNIRHKRKVKAQVDRLSASFLADDLSGNRAPRLRVSLACKGFDGVANDTLLFKAKRAMASTSVMPNKEHTFVPTGAVRLYFDSVLWSTPRAGMVLDSTLLTFDATPRFRQFKRIAKNQMVRIPDSLQKAINLDSLYKMGMQVMQSDDVSETYLKHFTNKGHIYLKSFRMRDPNFPLRTSLRKVDISFNDDTLQLDDLRLRVGRSNMRLSGEVSNMRRYLLRGKTLQANLGLTSRRLDLNQLLRAANTAMSTMPTDSLVAQDNAELAESDTLGLYDESEEIAVDSLTNASLIMLPSNLDLCFNAHVDSVFFSKMRLADFKGRVRVKDQVMTIANLSTSTQVGKAAMHVSYTCKQPQSADVALAVDMDSVQIGSLIHAMPELDSIMPMLRSFDGSVACELSANAQLDSAMNIKLPSVNAGAWLRGDSLVLMDGETFSEIAKMLMFSKKTRNVIDSVSVELVVKNNEIEIYPFMVSMDKYRLGVGGTQGLDASFDYHIALLKPIRLGLDVYGKDFDHIKFRLSSSKFKDGKTVIGKGGYLIRDEEVNVRKIFHDKVVQDILEDNE
ncbi:MAG: AsmA-like C-terminal region-containing protein, partial [Paludibacteraceae bacterium]|nr:AsmA-like C-terminal region-containing protein [Paludibacteraceae bacterium]